MDSRQTNNSESRPTKNVGGGGALDGTGGGVVSRNDPRISDKMGSSWGLSSGSSMKRPSEVMFLRVFCAAAQPMSKAVRTECIFARDR